MRGFLDMSGNSNFLTLEASPPSDDPIEKEVKHMTHITIARKNMPAAPELSFRQGFKISLSCLIDIVSGSPMFYSISS